MEKFGYVRGGYASVLNRFAKVLEEKGVEFRLNSPVKKIEKLSSGEIRVLATEKDENAKEKPDHIEEELKLSQNSLHSVVKNSSIQFDKVILTCPSSIAAKILPQLDETEKQKLENIKYQGIVCASVLTKKSLSEFYVTNITDETPFTEL